MQLEALSAVLPPPHLGGEGGGGGVKKYHFNRYKFRYTILAKFASRRFSVQLPYCELALAKQQYHWLAN